MPGQSTLELAGFSDWLDRDRSGRKTSEHCTLWFSGSDRPDLNRSSRSGRKTSARWFSGLGPIRSVQKISEPGPDYRLERSCRSGKPASAMLAGFLSGPTRPVLVKPVRKTSEFKYALDRQAGHAGMARLNIRYITWVS
ncbi:hypothetical protein TIFTF001_014129 [Ficus carica]|uniref:Uncharacterized protein n=1 Tax=Ficus carica TaxID=3494 RepID=A0AA88AFH2_FICCA|nr:hypothetical protein TIFTF001_014129 [Ficus carica]